MRTLKFTHTDSPGLGPSGPTAIFSANSRASMVLARATRDRTAAAVGFGVFPLATLLRPLP
jgi:hypothetical protein